MKKSTKSRRQVLETYLKRIKRVKPQTKKAKKAWRKLLLKARIERSKEGLNVCQVCGRPLGKHSTHPKCQQVKAA